MNQPPKAGNKIEGQGAPDVSGEMPAQIRPEDRAPDANAIDADQTFDFEPDIRLEALDETTPAPLRRGVENIRAHWQHAPVGPGVYRMIGDDGEVLYVGKAKSVRKRIAS